MSSPPTFLIKLREDGSIRVMRSNGDDCTEADVDLFKGAVQKELRVRNLEAGTLAREDIRKAIYEREPDQGRRFPIDPLLPLLEKERKRRGLTRVSIAQAMFIDPSKLSNYLSGNSRPSLETLRMWWYVLGFRLMYVPIPLADKIKGLIEEFIERDTKARAEGEL